MLEIFLKRYECISSFSVDCTHCVCSVILQFDRSASAAKYTTHIILDQGNRLRFEANKIQNQWKMKKTLKNAHLTANTSKEGRTNAFQRPLFSLLKIVSTSISFTIYTLRSIRRSSFPFRTKTFRV